MQRRSAIADYCKCLLAHYADLEEERRREEGGEKDSHAWQPLLLTTAAESWARLEDALSLCLSLSTGLALVARRVSCLASGVLTAERDSVCLGKVKP